MKSSMAALYGHYDEVIDQMFDEFTSHEFILRLAQQNQSLYIRALFDHVSAPDPFRQVHGTLSKRLHQHQNRVRFIDKVESKNIFNADSKCARWKKI